MAEREEELQLKLFEFEEEKNSLAVQKQKLSVLFGKLMDVEASIQNILITGQQESIYGSGAAGSSVPPRSETDVLPPPATPSSTPRTPSKPVRQSLSTNLPFSPSTREDDMVLSQDLPIPPVAAGGCYLVYEPDSSGRLVEYYSREEPIPNAIGRWVPCGTKKIAGFKFKSKGNVVIAGCSGGVQGRKKYFSGWCQFVRSACHMQSHLTMWDPPGKGLNVDVWLYTNDSRPGYQSVKLKQGESYETSNVLAVAVMPKNSQFYDQAMKIDLDKWLGEGFDLGSSIRI